MCGRIRHARAVALLLGLVAIGGGAVRLRVGAAPPRPFAALVERLSEPPGDFDTDNLVSNERSYLRVATALRQARIGDGAYIGVGPDQNFSYVAQLRPAIAFVIDVRRDNLLLHLLFKALFELAHDRVEYLALLTGRPPPARQDGWTDAALEKIVGYIDATPSTPAAVGAARSRADARIREFGVPLSPADVQTIDRFHRAFVAQGLSIRFQSHGRPPRSHYPTYRELLLQPDGDGRLGSYLASDADFRFVQSLEARDLVIPVVGDLAGPHAIPEIGRVLSERGARLAAIYVSNVELYLFRAGAFARFAENVGRLPRADRSILVRSFFAGPYQLPFPPAPGDASVSAAEPVGEFVAAFAGGAYRTYADLIARSSRP